MKPTTVNLTQLRAILAATKGATPVSFLAVTDARARTTNNPLTKLGPCYKVTRISAMLNTDHTAAVVRQQAREGVAAPVYEPSPRSWGTRLGALVEHKGDYYLPVQLNPAVRARPVYLAPQIRRGKVRLLPVAKETIAPFLPADRSAAVAEHQGVERAVQRRDFKLSSIVALSLNGQHLRVRS